MKKEYIVGVDFGYEVTSAWIISLFDNFCGESLKLKATNKELYFQSQMVLILWMIGKEI